MFAYSTNQCAATDAVEACAETEKGNCPACRLVDQWPAKVGRADRLFDPDFLMFQPEGRNEVPAAGQTEHVFREDRAVPGVARLIEARSAAVGAARGDDVGAGPLPEGRVVMVEDGAESEGVTAAPALAEPHVEALAAEFFIDERRRRRRRTGRSRALLQALPCRPKFGFHSPAGAEVDLVSERRGRAVDPIVVERRDRLIRVGEKLREAHAAGIARACVVIVKVEIPGRGLRPPVGEMDIALPDP